ncbi:ZF-HD homeobox-like protein, partial [Trifolium pratense]
SSSSVVRYRECLKNHAAAMGGNATDGCGEFMPSGEQGTIEALNCSACHCHRNFHRKEVEGDSTEEDSYYHHNHNSSSAFNFNFNRQQHHHSMRKFMLPLPDLGYHHHHHHPTPPNNTASAATTGNNNNNILPSRAVPPPPHGHGHIIMPFNYNIPSESDEQEDQAGRPPTHHHQQQQQVVMKKRFRTKFTQEQKDKMFNFAEKVGWKFQKQEESLVQQFCQEIGVKRRVLKVWMHNNKHNLAKKQLQDQHTTTANHLPTP